MVGLRTIQNKKSGEKSRPNSNGTQITITFCCPLAAATQNFSTFVHFSSDQLQETAFGRPYVGKDRVFCMPCPSQRAGDGAVQGRPSPCLRHAHLLVADSQNKSIVPYSKKLMN